MEADSIFDSGDLQEYSQIGEDKFSVQRNATTKKNKAKRTDVRVIKKEAVNFVETSTHVIQDNAMNHNRIAAISPNIRDISPTTGSSSAESSQESEDNRLEGFIISDRLETQVTSKHTRTSSNPAMERSTVIPQSKVTHSVAVQTPAGAGILGLQSRRKAQMIETEKRSVIVKHSSVGVQTPGSSLDKASSLLKDGQRSCSKQNVDSGLKLPRTPVSVKLNKVSIPLTDCQRSCSKQNVDHGLKVPRTPVSVKLNKVVYIPVKDCQKSSNKHDDCGLTISRTPVSVKRTHLDHFIKPVGSVKKKRSLDSQLFKSPVKFVNVVPLISSRTPISNNISKSMSVRQTPKRRCSLGDIRQKLDTVQASPSGSLVSVLSSFDINLLKIAKIPKASDFNPKVELWLNQVNTTPRNKAKSNTTLRTEEEEENTIEEHEEQNISGIVIKRHPETFI